MQYNMEVHSLTELLKSQQNQILSLSLHMDCLIEELASSGVLDTKKFDKRLKKKVKEIESIAQKIKENEESSIINYFGGPIGEA